jgi:probable rRNA maturation factor
MMPALDVSIETEAWSALADAPSRAEQAIAAALRCTDACLPAGAEVSLVLCDDAFIRDLNEKWRGRDTPTNVLSFPSAQQGTSALLGDIVIAFETTAREASQEGKTLADHFSHLVVHGFLHLLGYDHVEDAEADAMEAAERRILAALGIADPFQGASLQIAD